MMIRGRLKYSAKVLNTKFIFLVENFENGFKIVIIISNREVAFKS